MPKVIAAEAEILNAVRYRVLPDQPGPYLFLLYNNRKLDDIKQRKCQLLIHAKH